MMYPRKRAVSCFQPLKPSPKPIKRPLEVTEQPVEDESPSPRLKTRRGAISDTFNVPEKEIPPAKA
jgi:hypothetical protein